ncbi:hypothetical protein RAC89_23835 [Paenibacillus sp. GD4]|uniref:hypothetical protein n=1 Tax=Paenibacillus sp. GD4 TaxID=3068890 RepID=UPI0027967E55|nr:hypothetical protein [Paenibacillus sp. GD4]MDQ1913433.1 hypothetical protein [Paenibacillus sp. GD4]
MTIREDHVLQELRRRSPQALELLMNEYSGVLYSLASRIMNFLYERLEAIAERYGMTKEAVENRLYRSRVQLRSKLSLWFKEETSHDG